MGQRYWGHCEFQKQMLFDRGTHLSAQFAAPLVFDPICPQPRRLDALPGRLRALRPPDRQGPHAAAAGALARGPRRQLREGFLYVRLDTKIIN